VTSAGNGHSCCILCGSLNPRSLNLSFEDTEEGGVTTRFQTGEELQGYDHLLHGGIIAALLDSAMTHCLFHKGIHAVTGDLHVRFLKPIPCSSMLEIRARLISSRSRMYVLRGEILLDDRLMAWSEAKFVRRQSSDLPERGKV